MAALDGFASGSQSMENATNFSKQSIHGKYTVGVEIRDQSMPFMFEAANLVEGQLVRYVLPLNPETYRISHPTRAVATQTLGGVFEDNIGLGLPRITIQGTFGYYGTLDGGGGRHVTDAKLDGWELYQELEAVFLSFYQAFGTYSKNIVDTGSVTVTSATEKMPELRFFNFSDKDSFVVQLNKFDVLRNTQRRHLYQYDIQMTVLGRYTSKYSMFSTNEEGTDTESIKNLKRPQKVKETTWLGNLISAYSSAMGTMSNIQDLCNQITDKINQVNSAVTGFTNGITSTIKAPFSLVRNSLGILDNMISQVEKLGNLPHEITNELRQIKQGCLALCFHKDKFQEDTTINGAEAVTLATTTEVMTSALPNPELAAANKLVVMNNPEKTMFTTQTTNYTGATTEASIIDGATIETVAAALLGSATQWQALAAINNLEYPYVAQTPAGQVSAVLSTTALNRDVAEGSRTVVVNNSAEAAAGSYLMIENTIYQIESVAQTDIVLTTPLKSSHTSGTSVSFHERKLAVLIPGDKIKAPTNSRSTATIFEPDVKKFTSKMYGTDELLDADGNQEPDSGGDVADISGYDNLSMQLQHRLATVQGELAQVGHPQYGSLLPTFIGKAGIKMWYERARMEAEKAILDDPRVQKIENMKFSVNNGAVYITADIIPIAQTSAQKVSIVVN